jgi:CBS domain-containing protein
MPDKANRPGNRLMDRPEYRLKQQPLTCSADTSVFDAVLAMSEKNFGAIVVVDKLKK